MKTTGEFVRELNEKYPSDLGREFAFSAGKKYDRIITSYNGQNASAYAFVEKATGLLFKPASWASPAKHSRGNINDESGLAACNEYGVKYLR